MENLLLPIGSVVKLKEGNGLIMIDGYLVNDTRKADKYYDYVGCEYPLGFRSENMLLFYHDDIDEVMFIGYQAGSSTDVRRKVTQIKEKLDSGMTLNEAVAAVKPEEIEQL